MGMLNHWDVSGGVYDFWTYIREPRPHRWASWGLAVVLPGLILYGFSTHLFPYPPPKAEIVYFENWAADRSQTDVQADWVQRAIETNRANALRRAEYQRLADRLGIEYDSSEADEITRETLGAEADALAKAPAAPAPPKRSNIGERAARGPQAAATPPAPAARQP